jgi:hypothetical protein
MITLALIFSPMIIALLVWISGKLKLQIALVNIAAWLHAAGTLLLWLKPQWDERVPAAVRNRVGQDSLSLTVLAVISLLFLLAAMQTVKYFSDGAQTFFG